MRNPLIERFIVLRKLVGGPVSSEALLQNLKLGGSTGDDDNHNFSAQGNNRRLDLIIVYEWFFNFGSIAGT